MTGDDLATMPGSTALNGSSSKKVAYFYDSDIGNYAYVTGHPMKPHRIRLAHSLIMQYNLYQKMEIYVRQPLAQDMQDSTPKIPNAQDGMLIERYGNSAQSQPLGER